MPYFNVVKGIKCILIGLMLFSINIVTHAPLALGASASVSVSVQGDGGVRATVNGSFATCTYCVQYGANNSCINTTTTNSGSVSLVRDGGYLCSSSGNGSASCSAIVDRGSLHGTHVFSGYASDCRGSSSNSYTLTLDNTPTISVTGPSGTVSAPFDVTGTATFKPTLNPTKGTIYAYVNGYYVGGKSCSSENCTYSYQEQTGSLYDLHHGGPYTVIMYAYGGGAYASDSKTFTIDKMPTVSVTGPTGTLSAPFDVTGTATFKPTLNSTKGTIYAYINGGYVGSKTCTTESCTFSYLELMGKLYDMNHGGPYTVIMYAYGGGAYASDSKTFTVDKMPTVTVTGPTGTVSAPFDITGTATFKPTLSSTKGYIYAYVNGNYVGVKPCPSESCTYSYQELTGSLYDLHHGGPYTVSMMAYGGGASASDSKTFTVDKMPTVTVIGPTGTVSAPFDVTGTATFKPTLNSTKGTIYAYINGGYVGSKTCTTESCTFSYLELTGKLYDMNHGGPYTVIMVVYGGGAYASDSKTFTVDKMPTVSVTGPTGTVSAPFDVTGTATFKPTLNPTKGTIYAYVNGYYVGGKSCSSENCTYSYQEQTGNLYNMSIGGPYKVKMIVYGGGASASDEKTFYVSNCLDNDHDGYYAYNAASCPQGNDCNDGDPSINPGTIWYKDADNDGYTNGMTIIQCQRPAGYKLSSELTSNQVDCDDNNANVNTIITWYKDADGDGYTDGQTLQQCTQPSGYVQSAVSGDCNDDDGTIHPGAYEVCDGVDNNCNGDTDETCTGQSCNNGTDVGSSANFASGNLYHSQDLITGSKNNLTISYNSLDTYVGPLGRGWTHNYNIRIIENQDSSITLIKGDGKRVYYWPDEGIYYPEMRSGEYSTIVKNADGTYTLTSKDGAIQAFDHAGRLMSVMINRNGNTTALTYRNNDLAAIKDPAGKTTTIASAGGKITAITTPDGKTYALTYSGSLLTSIIDPEGNAWQYTYDGNERMLTKTDPQGYTTTYNYDGSGKLISSTDPEGKTKTIYYDQTNNTATVTEKDGGIWTYQYDNSLNVTLKKTDPENGTTSYTYDENRNMTSKTEPDGSVTSYTYDNSGNMTSTTDALDQTTTYTYNAYGQVTSITDPQNNTTTYEYDTTGNLTKTTDATGASTSYQYDAKGNVIQIKDAVGQTTSFTYDQYNNLSSITDPTGATTSFTYDTAGNMTSQTDASGATTRFEYNSLGRLIKVIDPSGNATNSTYDANGNKTSETDANGNTTYYEYNYKGQLIKVKDALGNVTTYTYGGTGCNSCGGGTPSTGSGQGLTVITDANGNATKYEYDRLGRLTKETDPLGNAISYTYDSKGNLLSKTDANGATVNYSYDGLGRLLKKAYPDNSTETFTYDAKGNILTATNSNVSYTFGYSTSGKVMNVTDSNGRAVSYQYNALGNKTKLTYPEGSTVMYSYDSANRLKSIVNGGGRTYTYSYDSLGRRTKLSLPNGTSANYSYDTIERLTSLTHKTSSNSTIASFAYTHDNVGNRLTKTQSPSPLAGEGGVRGNADVKHTYNYDAIYRLTEALSSTPGYSSNTNGKGNGIATATQQQKEFYTYDAVGNRLSSDKYSSYTYNQANQLQTNGGIYSYDKNGNLTSKIEGTTVYGYYYDYENRLAKVVKVENGATTTSEYKYDPFGRRIEKKVTESGTTTTTRFVYDNEDIILEYDGSGNIGNRYVHGPGIDEPLAVINGKNSYYYHADGLGSIVALTDGSGKVQQTYEYDSFGNLKDQKNKVKQPYTFTGREWDRETGLYYMRARYLDAKTGHWTSFDRILHPANGPKTKTCTQNLKYPVFESLINNPQKLNPYVYVENRPIVLTDPTGLAAIGNTQQRYSCISSCVQGLLSSKWNEFKCCATEVGIAGVTFGTVTCAAIVAFEPYLAPTFPACAGLASTSTTVIGVGLCMTRVEVGGLAAAAGCVAGCYGW